MCRGARLVIVEVRREVKMQQKPSKQKRGGGAGLSEMEVYEETVPSHSKVVGVKNLILGGAREKPRRPNFNTQEGENVKNGGARSEVGWDLNVINLNPSSSRTKRQTLSLASAAAYHHTALTSAPPRRPATGCRRR